MFRRLPTRLRELAMSLPPLEETVGQSGLHLKADFVYGVASMHSGLLVDRAPPNPMGVRLEELAAAIPELFTTTETARLERLWERLGSEGGHDAFQEILMFCAEHIHIVQPLQRRPDRALLMVSPSKNSVGLVLSVFRAKLAELESE
jgi:hypothetical protein